MFGFLFKRKKGAETNKEMEQAAPVPVSGTHLYYHANLIENLTDDHQTLLDLFGKISAAYEEKNFDVVSKNLNKFSGILRGHLLAENVKLYVYLQHVLANDDENSAIIRDFRKEMQSIGKAVNDFLHKYSIEDWGTKTKQSFGGDLAAIGEVLVKRIEMEERALYPLYMPPDAYL